MSCKNLLSGSLAALYNGVGDFVAPNPMRKTKFEDRIDNAVNAFFETEPDRSHFAMTYTGCEAALAIKDLSFSEKADKWLRVLREIFMFGPGTFCLFYLTLTMVFFFPALGFSSQGILMYLFAVFLTYAGSGSIARVRNLAIPATVTLLAIAFALLSPLFFGNELADLYFWHSIYVFPFVLVAAKLVQSWVGDK